MVVLQEPRKGLERILDTDIEKLEITSVKELLSKILPLFRETIKQDGIGSVQKIAEGFESRYGIIGLTEILIRKGREYLKHKLSIEPEYGNLRKFYDMKRVEAIMFFSKLSQNNAHRSYGSIRYHDGTRLVDDYKNYQSIFWTHKWL